MSMQLISTYVRKVDGEELKYIFRKKFIAANSMIHMKRNLYSRWSKENKENNHVSFQFIYVDPCQFLFHVYFLLCLRYQCQFVVLRYLFLFLRFQGFFWSRGCLHVCLSACIDIVINLSILSRVEEKYVQIHYIHV